MAFSLGNIISGIGNAAKTALSPVYGLVSGLGNAAKSVYQSVSSQPTTVQPSSASLPSGNFNNSTQFSTPSFSVPLPTVGSTQSTNAGIESPLKGAYTPAPVVPNTIPTSSVQSQGGSITTVPSPTTVTPSVGTFSPTVQASPGTSAGTTPSATTPGSASGTPTSGTETGTPSVPTQSNPAVIPADLLTPTSSASILDTQKAITDVNTRLQGKNAALQAAEVKAKVPEYQQQLNDVISQINATNSQAVAEQVRIGGQPIDSAFRANQIGSVERAKTVKLLGLSAVASALQGNLALAQDYAQKSVNAEFAPIEAQLETLKQQLEFNKDNFTRDEKIRADKLTIALQDKQQALQDAKDAKTQINGIALEAAKNGADAQTLNSILNATDVASALGAARGSFAKATGIGIYNLSEAQANIAEKLADDFEKATGSFTQVRDAYSKIQSAQNGTGIGDTALIFAYMKMLDPTSVVREGEFATVQNAGGIPQKFLQAYNGALNGEKLAPSVRKEILDTSSGLYDQALKIQGQTVEQYNNRAVAYGIPTDLVTRDVGAGVTLSGAAGATGATRDQIYAKLKAKYPDATDMDLQAATQKYIDNPALQKDLGFPSDLGTSVNGPTSTTTGTGARTDRHNNPTAFTTDVAKAAGLKLGVDYTIGDAFPNNPSLKTAKLLGDPIATTVKVIDRIGFQTSSGNPRWTYINIPKSTWDSYTYDQKRKVIGQMYQHEGGVSLSSLFA